MTRALSILNWTQKYPLCTCINVSTLHMRKYIHPAHAYTYPPCTCINKSTLLIWLLSAPSRTSERSHCILTEGRSPSDMTDVRILKTYASWRASRQDARLGQTFTTAGHSQQDSNAGHYERLFQTCAMGVAHGAYV